MSGRFVKILTDKHENHVPSKGQNLYEFAVFDVKTLTRSPSLTCKLLQATLFICMQSFSTMLELKHISTVSCPSITMEERKQLHCCWVEGSNWNHAAQCYEPYFHQFHLRSFLHYSTLLCTTPHFSHAISDHLIRKTSNYLFMLNFT